MKKTNLILLVAVIVLAIIAAIIYFAQNTDKKSVYRDFAVQDTASVDKIFMADKNNNTITLERKQNYWIVNQKYKARRDLTNLLLETILKIEVSAPVPDSKLDKVLKDISTSGIKTEIYQNGELTKTYYVGGVTEDNTGTYMIMEGSDLPFIIRIPGFNGFLTVRYATLLNEWREKQIFNYDVNDIARVMVEYPGMAQESFIAYSKGNNVFDLTNIDGSAVDFDFDTLLVKEYISRCKFVGFEAYIMDELQDKKRDSLMNEPVVSKISVEDRAGDVQSVKIYYRPNLEKLLDDNGELFEWDIDRLYGIINDKEVVLVQYYILDPITFKKSDFKIKN